jgi:hypothetical protein
VRSFFWAAGSTECLKKGSQKGPTGIAFGSEKGPNKDRSEKKIKKAPRGSLVVLKNSLKNRGPNRDRGPKKGHKGAAFGSEEVSHASERGSQEGSGWSLLVPRIISTGNNMNKGPKKSEKEVRSCPVALVIFRTRQRVPAWTRVKRSRRESKRVAFGYEKASTGNNRNESLKRVSGGRFWFRKKLPRGTDQEGRFWSRKKVPAANCGVALAWHLVPYFF